MKAILMRAPKDLRFEEVPQPQPAADEVLIQVMAVGVCGSDIPRMLTYGAHVSPIIPGHEFAGKVVALGADVRGWKVGDKASAAPLIPCGKCEWCRRGVYSLCEDYRYYGSRNDGAYAQFLAVKAANLLRLGPDIPYDWGATIDPAANALHAYLRGRGTAEDMVCVFGLGAIGLFAVQYTRVLGCKTIVAVDVDEGKLETARACGASFTINSAREDAVAKLFEATNGRGADLALEMSGAPQAQHQAILCAAKMGRVVFLGISHRGLELSEAAVDGIQRRQLSVIGSWNSFSDPFPGFEWTESARLMNERKFNPDLLISHRYPLEALPDVFQRIDARAFIYDKIMFYPNGMEERA